jgi:hypothetical protein
MAVVGKRQVGSLDGEPGEGRSFCGAHDETHDTG